MTAFDNRAEAGRQLATALRDIVASMQEPLLVAIAPDGVPVAVPVADALGLPLACVSLEREGEPRVTQVPDVMGREVIVVDDGVETGTAAGLVGMALREAGASRLALAAPVCPRQAEAGLQALYDAIVAIHRPLARRDLRWHYVDFDSIDEAEAQRQLDAR
jgi:predicted phosphoribosyltransferase